MSVFKFGSHFNNEYKEERRKYIRETLIFTLSENLKECEYHYKSLQVPLELSDATSSLCSTVEAIFIHGLKDSLLQNTLSILESDVDRRPCPNFWAFLCKFLHNHTIQELKDLSQVNTKIGYSRAFVRKSLNEKILSSYFSNIRSNPSTLNSYYHKYAFLQDNELTEIVENLLLGTESYIAFNLPLNSSLLNVWNDSPLSLSGIYVTPLRSLPFAIGEDIAGSITNSTQNIRIPIATSNIPDIYPESISNSIFSQSPFSLDKDDKFERFMVQVQANTEDLGYEDIHEENNKEEDAAETVTNIAEPCDFPPRNDDSENERYVMGNSINDKQSWSEPPQLHAEEESEEQKIQQRSLSIRTDEHSFMTLFNEKQQKDFKDIWSKFQKTVEICSPSNQKFSTEAEEFPEGFEVIKKPSSDNLDLKELQKMVETLCRLPNECGLDTQGYMCYDCRTLLGVDLSKANLCHFDGHYYCACCISNDKFQIPSKIIYNWDFIQYKVSRRAATFLIEYQFKPFLDLKILNPIIYSYIDQMNVLQKLRIQLNYIRAYIFTCSETAIGEFRKLLYGKEYIYESIHLYSTADLSLISSGALENMLKKVIAVSKDHCLKCNLCSVKGFICEFCKKSCIIYPFDVDDTSRCNNCGTVSHIGCFDPTIPCPKCERRRKRQLEQLLESSDK